MPAMHANTAIALVILALLLGTAYYLPTLRRRQRERQRELERRESEGEAEARAREAAEVTPPVEVEPAPAVEIEKPAPTAGRLVRLRARLSRSQNVFGKGLLALLSRDKLDEDTWEELEETLITADVGVQATTDIVAKLRERARIHGTATATDLRGMLADELVAALEPDRDRALAATPRDGRPAVLLVGGVNGAGK